MNVLCIDAKNCTPGFIYEGEVYEVEKEGAYFDIPVLYLMKFAGKEFPWRKSRFIPTSNKNELSVAETIFSKNNYDLKQLIHENK